VLRGKYELVELEKEEKGRQRGRSTLCLLGGSTIEQKTVIIAQVTCCNVGIMKIKPSYLQHSMYPIKLQNPISSTTYINFVFQNSFQMVKTTKSSSQTSKKKGKADSRVHSRSGKVNSRKRRRTTTKQSSKATGRTRRKKSTKMSDIIIKRTSGRREKFETGKMAQTVSRSGTPFLLARDIAKTVSEKVMRKGNDITAMEGGEEEDEKMSSPSTIEVDAGEVRKMVAEELKERNRPDIASSYSGERPENTRHGRHELMKENQPLHDADAENQSKLLFDSSTNMAKSTRPSTMKR
jgi:transcriptional repressor NrdR